MSIISVLVIGLGVVIATWLFLFLRKWFPKLIVSLRISYEIEKVLTYEWQFLDQILISVEKSKVFQKFLKDKNIHDLGERRAVIFFYLAIETRGVRGKAQVALLTENLTSAYRSLISSFPEEYRQAYAKAMVLRLAKHAIVVNDDGTIEEKVLSDNDIQTSQQDIEKICDWEDVVIPEESSELMSFLEEKEDSVIKNRVVFRFKKNPIHGKRRPRRKIAELKPVFGLTPMTK